MSAPAGSNERGDEGPDETERWLHAVPLLIEGRDKFNGMLDANVRLHDGVVAVGALLPGLYGLATGLEMHRDPSLAALADRLTSLHRIVMTLASGVAPLDDVMIEELRHFPEFVRHDIERAIANRKAAQK
jgi:hypothetical protein